MDIRMLVPAEGVEQSRMQYGEVIRSGDKSESVVRFSVPVK